MSQIAAQNSGVEVAEAHWPVRLLLLLFLLLCIFDPANVMLGAKTYVFAALWPLTLLSAAARKRAANTSPWLLAYVLAFVAIPVLSVLWYFLIDGRSPFEGFQLLRGYLLISLALILFVNRVDLMPQLAAVLTGLACAVIAVFLFLQIAPDQFRTLKEIGIRSGTLYLDRRTYGPGLRLDQIYFVTSPLLVFSAAYYFHNTMLAKHRRDRLILGGVTAVNLLGMILAGSRNNILTAVLLPCLLWPLYTKRTLRNALIGIGVLALCALPFVPQLRIFFDPGETANSIRLALLSDYARIFSNPVTLLVGDGLGAYQYWNARGYSYFISELTYLELVRNFGLFGAAVMMMLLLLPVWWGIVHPVTQQQRALALAFLLYLVMCATNPNLFSSMGILALSILLADAAMRRPEP